MREAEDFGVEGEAIDRVQRAAVELIADYGMSALREMRADLILAAGLETHLQHGVAIIRLDRAVVRDRQLSVGMRVDAAHAEVASLEKMRSNRPAPRREFPFDDCNV